MTGCTLGEMLRLTPSGQQKMAAINLKKSDAYVLGEIRGNLMAQGKDKDPRVLLEWGKIQTAVDAEIKKIMDKTY